MSVQDVKIGSRDCRVLSILEATTAQRNFGRRNAVQIKQLNSQGRCNNLVITPCMIAFHRRNSQNKKIFITCRTAIFCD